MDEVEKRKFLTPPGLELRPFGRLAPQPVAISTTLSRLHMPTVEKKKYHQFHARQLKL
jgi:hypothetical protein